MRARAGFTLTELLAVLAVTAAVAVSAAPALSGAGSAARAAAARQVQRDLTWARQRAMATGITHWVSFDVAGRAYAVLAEDRSAPGRTGALTVTDPATQRPMAITMQSGAAVTGVSLEGGAEVGFDRLGRPVLAAGGLVASAGTISMDGGHVVIIEANGGLVRWVSP